MPPRSKSPARSPRARVAKEEEDDDTFAPVQVQEPFKSEAQVTAHYTSLFGKILFLQAPVIACMLYFAARYSGAANSMDLKFAFMHTHQLGWAFACWYVIYLMRLRVGMNVSAMRGPARLNVSARPAHLPALLRGHTFRTEMATEARRVQPAAFNRAQRAACNTDEGLILFLSGLILVAAVFGPVALGLALLSFVGRNKFAVDYTRSNSERGGGFLMSAVAEHGTAGCVALCAAKTIAGAAFPF